MQKILCLCCAMRQRIPRPTVGTARDRWACCCEQGMKSIRSGHGSRGGPRSGTSSASGPNLREFEHHVYFRRWLQNGSSRALRRRLPPTFFAHADTARLASPTASSLTLSPSPSSTTVNRTACSAPPPPLSGDALKSREADSSQRCPPCCESRSCSASGWTSSSRQPRQASSPPSEQKGLQWMRANPKVCVEFESDSRRRSLQLDVDRHLRALLRRHEHPRRFTRARGSSRFAHTQQLLETRSKWWLPGAAKVKVTARRARLTSSSIASTSTA